MKTKKTKGEKKTLQSSNLKLIYLTVGIYVGTMPNFFSLGTVAFILFEGFTPRE